MGDKEAQVNWDNDGRDVEQLRAELAQAQIDKRVVQQSNTACMQEAIVLHTHLSSARAARDTLARECNQLEADREHNASLVMGRDRELTRMRKAAQEQGDELKNLQGANRALGQQVVDVTDNRDYWYKAAQDAEVERDRWRGDWESATAELLNAQTDLKLNTKMLADQCDQARQAENERDEWRRKAQEQSNAEEIITLRTELMQARVELNCMRVEIQEQSEVEITGKEMVQALQNERQLRREAERYHEAALTIARNRGKRLEKAEQRAATFYQELSGAHEALDECQIRHNYNDGERASIRTRIFWLNERAEKAEALAQLVNEETVILLERLALDAWAVGDDDLCETDIRDARALAAEIRRVLDDSHA